MNWENQQIYSFFEEKKKIKKKISELKFQQKFKATYSCWVKQYQPF
jgi:hypothetical protein